MNISSSISHDTRVTAQVAVLVDGENVSASHVSEILERSAQQGALRIRRVYGNVAKLRGWEAEPGIDIVHTGSGKNSADIKMSIDAVDLATRDMANRFVIVSSDSDFIHLAQYLRENGFSVTGLGEDKSPIGFQRACDRFFCLSGQCAANADQVVKRRQVLDQKLIEMIKSRGTGQGVLISEVNQKMRRKSEVKISRQPEKTWRGYFSQRPNLYRCDPKGPKSRVYLQSGI